MNGALPASGSRHNLRTVTKLSTPALLATLVGATVLFAAPAAQASTDLGSVDGISYVGATSSGTPPASAATDVECPDGTRPTGGGFDVGVSQNHLYNSYPADLFDPFGPGALETVRTQVWLPSGGSQEIAGYAICRAGPLSYRVEEGTLPASPRARSLTAKCPDDRHVLGGGAAAGQGGSVAAAFVNSSYPIDDGDPGRAPDDGWKARVYGADQAAAAAFAVCAKTKQRYVKLNGAESPGGASNINGVSCPTELHLLATGGRIKGDPAEGRLRSAVPYDSGSDGDDVPDDGAYLQLANIAVAGPNKETRAYVVCG